MRRSSLLFLIFIAAILSSVALFPLLFDDKPNVYISSNGQCTSITSIPSDGIKAIVTDIPELDLQVAVDSTATEFSVESLANSYSIEYQDSTSTLFITRGKEYPASGYYMISITAPASNQLSIVKGIATGELRLRSVSSPSLVVVPFPTDFNAADCHIDTLFLGRNHDHDKALNLKLTSCTISAFISAVATSEINMNLSDTSIGSFLSASQAAPSAQ